VLFLDAPSPPPRQVTDDLPRLPPYALTALLHKLRSQCLDELNPPAPTAEAVLLSRQYPPNASELLPSIPTVVTLHNLPSSHSDTYVLGSSPDVLGSSPVRENSTLTSLLRRYSTGLPLRSRHAVRLLQRSPSCPLLTATSQPNATLQRYYDK
jgi:hypothetical protein